MLGAAALALLTVAYLGGLFVIAALVDRGVGRRLARHPAATALAMGVYATSWTFFASVGFAATEGWRFLTIYVGATLSCTLVPVVWAPLMRVVKSRQLASLADLFAYRFQSRAAGGIVTGLLLVSSLPYQALQLRATVETVAELGGESARTAIAAVITGLLVLFGVMYGVRHLTPRERHDGLVAAVAAESLVKLLALGAAAGYALVSVFGGFAGLSDWLAHHPDVLAAATRPARESTWAALLFLSATAIFLLPRQWHMGFTEGDERGLRAASYGLPLYLFLLNLPVPLILWAGQALALPQSPDFYALGLVNASGSPALAVIVFLGAMSASAAMIVVTTVALAGMVQNHIVLPLTGFGTGRGDLYPRLRWLRRGLVAGIILAGYAVHLATARQERLVDLGLVAFVAVAQVVPGLVGVLVWPRATQRGVVAGLCAGIVAWIATPVVPLLAASGALPASWMWLGAFETGTNLWTFSTVLSLGANGLAFVVASLAREPTPAEREAAEICRRQTALPGGALVGVTSAAGFTARLEPVLGAAAARTEIARALSDLGLDAAEARPEKLRALRDGLERNLSGLLGPITARMIVDERLAVDAGWRSLISAQLRYAEEQLAAARLEGPARALEQARRFLRGVLEDLPVGVAALGPAGDIALWNEEMARVSAVPATSALGQRLADLPEPWGAALVAYVEGGENEVEILVAGRTLHLRRAEVDAPEPGGHAILIEDRSERRALEARVAHQERLASIGRLAAGVAHEVGNPLTGIASLAQNLRIETADPDIAERLGLILEQTRRIDRIVRALMGFARTGVGATGAGGFGPVALAEVVADAVTLVRLGRAGRGAVIEVDIPDDLVVRGDRQRLEQVTVNLLANACDASPAGGRVQIAAARAGERVRLTVADAGPGMSEEVQARIFEPFFTTKEPGEGTGLGLALVYSIVADHGGTVEVKSAPGAGTRMTVDLSAEARASVM